jgi:hypothetical protein
VTLTLPQHLSLFPQLPCKRPRDQLVCACGSKGKYCCPRTFKRFCSAGCFAKLRQGA